MTIPRVQKSPLVLIGYIPFLGRIIRSILIQHFRYTKLEYLVVKRMGALFLVDQHNKVDRSLLIKGEWEQEQICRLRELINRYRPKDTSSIFLDIGAHGGLYSIIVSKNYEFNQIFAFEPDSINRAQLHANLFINGLVDKICVVQAAATNRSGTIGFVSCRGRHRGLSHLQLDSRMLSDTTVDAVRIDDLIKQKGVFVAAKIDVEGYESGVLEGMEDLVKSNSCVLQIEIQDKLASIIEITGSYGLDTCWTDRSGFLFH